jgi:hypothetical protein
MGLVVAGMLNKQIGGALGISEITVKAHRGRAMHKMQSRSLADLVRTADLLGIDGTQSDGRICSNSVSAGGGVRGESGGHLD